MMNARRASSSGRALPAGAPRDLEYYGIGPLAYGDFNDDSIEDVFVAATAVMTVLEEFWKSVPPRALASSAPGS